MSGSFHNTVRVPLPELTYKLVIAPGVVIGATGVKLGANTDNELEMLFADWTDKKCVYVVPFWKPVMVACVVPASNMKGLPMMVGALT